MGTARNFSVKTGLDIDDGDLTLTDGDILLTAGFLQSTPASGNPLKINGSTISTLSGNHAINITPHGTGSVVISKSTLTTTDINAGTIDGATIGATSAAAGTFSTMTATTSVLGTLGGNVDHNNYNSTNVDINSGAIDGAPIGANSASTGAFTTLSATGAVTVGIDDTGHDVKFFGATTGKSMLWDESADQLKIVGTAGSVALDIDTGNFTVGAYGLTSAGAATIASMAGNWTNAGRTVADAGILTTVDINGGTIDAADITVGSSKTLDVSAGTLTLANDQISGDAITGGTIGVTTITALTTAGITATANLDIGAYTITGTRFISDIATGTAPLAVTSTTEVANLNVAKLSGADWDAPLAIGGTTAAAGTFSTLTATSLETTSWGKINGSAIESTTNFQVNASARSGGASGGTTIYAEARLYSDIANDDMAGGYNNYTGMANSLILENAENVVDSGQGIIYTVGTGADTGSTYAAGRMSSTDNRYTIGYFADNWDEIGYSNSANNGQDTENPLLLANSLLHIGADGDLTLHKSGGTLSFTSNTDKITSFVGSSSASASAAYVLPTAVPAGGSKILQSTTSGVMSWVAAGSGETNQNAWGVITVPAGTTTQTAAVDADSIAFTVADGIKITGGTDTIEFALNVDGAGASPIASGDLIAFADVSHASNRTQKESIDDIATLFAGTGLTAASAVISVDAAQTAATSSMTSSTSRTITTPLLSVESGTSSKPVIQIKNTHDGTTGAELKFVSNDASAGADGDDIGTISFYADDSGGNQTAFASILAEVSESLNTDEAGKLSFFIAESDGTNTAQTAALILEGEHATDGQVDVTIGAGVASTTTIVGDLVVNGSTTTISTAQLTVEDDLITVSKGNDTIANANGSGLEIDATLATNIAWKYNHATTAWQSNIDIDTSGTGNTYKINGTEVLNATTLGSAVVSSSLTSTGALNGGSITSDFGTIDTGLSTITTTGLISGGSLDIDHVLIDGTTIGHTDDTDLITLANGLVTVAGEISVTTLDIGGTNVTSTAAELNLVDGITAGTVAASKAVIVDSSKDITGFNDLTAAGAVKGATLSVDAVAILDTARGAASTITGATNLFSIAKATYKAAKLIYHIKKDDNNRTDAGEILVTHDGTNAFLTHYGQVSTDTAVVGTWDCTVNGANIEVRFTPTVNGAHTYGITATQMVV
ncbi:MAG: hypothetical protein CXT67_00590 [Methanobacteriota archaeon]|nr:MAG: hypothetical protein CXT67_00590 [Euryarchaeota archaeon]